MTGLFRLLLTGSRTITPDTRNPAGQTITDVLDDLCVVVARDGWPGLLLVHGACPKGADMLADRWAMRRAADGWRVTVERHPADWGKFGKRAGFVRNSEMARRGADRCEAFIQDASPGASMCADLAEERGIRTVRHHIRTAAAVIPDFDETDAEAARALADVLTPNHETA
jgi:hypothetical protein